MSTVSLGGMGTFNYTVSVDNSSDSGTITFTLNGFSINSSPAYKMKNGHCWAGVKIDGKNFIGKTAERAPSIKYSKKGQASITGTIGTQGSYETITDDITEYKYYKKLFKQWQKEYLEQNLNVLQNRINKKVQSGENKKTIKVTGNQRSITITFSIYGYKQTVSHNVGGTSTSSGSDASTQEGVEYTSITSVNNGIPYLIKQDAYEEYGWIERVVDFNDIDDPTVLKRVGQIYLDNLQFDDMSIEVTALDLHYIDNTIQRLDLLDSIRCISKPHGLDKAFPITKVTIPLDHPDQVKYTLGTNQAGGGGISASSSKDAKKFMKSLESFPTKAYTLDTAKAYSSTILNQRTTGYVTIVDRSENNQTHSEAIIISSDVDWTTSRSIWKWDMNGLGYSDKKISEMSDAEKAAMQTLTNAGKAVRANDDDRWYKLGITNDGTIVADVIKTGILSDGTGYNSWDLSNGIINLTVRSDKLILYDKNDNTKTTTAEQMSKDIDEVDSLATNASSLANAAFNKKVGATNYLTGTSNMNTTNSKNEGTNSKKKWHTVGTKNSSVTVSSFSNDSPASGVKKYVRLNNSGGINQYKIPVLSGTTYTISCYARLYNTKLTPTESNATLVISYGSSTNEIKITNKKVTVGKTWKRYSTKITITDYLSDERGSSTSSEDEIGGLIGGRSIRVSFSVGTTPDILICGLKMENGVSATDWCETQYVDAETIYEKSIAYTDVFAKAEADLVKDYFTQTELIKRIKGNGQGIWTTSAGQLVISGSYIQTGVIASKNGKTVYNSQQHKNVFVPDSSWNLTSGQLITNNAGLNGYLVSKSGKIGKCIGFNKNPGNSSYVDFYQIAQLKNGSFTSAIERNGKTYSLLNVGNYYHAYDKNAKLFQFPKGYINAPYGLTINLKPKSKINENTALRIIGSDRKHEECAQTSAFCIKYVNNVYMKNGKLCVEYDTASFFFLDGFYVSPWKNINVRKKPGGTWYG